MKLTIPISGLSWSDAAANTALIPYGGPGRNDIVTEYNAVSNFRQTRFFNTVRWQTLDAKIDGNLLVTGSVSAEALSAEAVNAVTGTFETLVTDNITANNATITGQLTALSATIDTLIADSITAAKAEIDTLIATEIDAVNGNFETLTVGTLRLEDGSVITSKLGSGAVVTSKITDNSVSVPVFLQSSSTQDLSASATYTLGPVSASFNAAAQVIINVALVAQGLTSPNGVRSFVGIEALVDGSVAGSTYSTQEIGRLGSHNYSVQVNVTAGSHNFAIRFTTATADPNTYTVINASATFLGVMK